MGSLGAGGRDRARVAAGWRVLVPGLPQWSWRQRERALVLFGSFAMALGVGVFGWGTRTSLALLAFAFATHVVATVDVVRQSAFPGFGRWMPLASATGGLAAGVYGPALWLATLLAWPGMPAGTPADGYLVNCWAYRARVPGRGDWVWLRTAPWTAPRIGRVVAGPGTELEWSPEALRVAGETLASPAPLHSARPPAALAYTVPAGHVLVDPNAGARLGESAGHLVLVPRDQILGRAWARYYPIRERRLLP